MVIYEDFFDDDDDFDDVDVDAFFIWGHTWSHFMTLITNDNLK